MQKNQIKSPVVFLTGLLVISAFGFFFRWLHNLNAFEPDTGFSIAGSATTVVFLLYCAVVIVALAVYSFYYIKKDELEKTAYGAFHDSTKVSQIVFFIAAIVTAIAGIIIVIGGADATNPTLTKLLGAFCIVAAIGYTSYPQMEGGSRKTGYLAICPVLFSFVWLIAGYKFNAYNPVVLAYTPEILAICFNAAAFLYLAGFYYGRTKPRLTLFFMAAATFFDITTLADSHGTAYSLVFIFAAIVFATMSFLLVLNRKKIDSASGD